MDISLFTLSIDQWIVVTFLVATLIVGIVSGLKIKTVRDYTVGEKGSFPTSVIAITLIATMIGGNATIGFVSEFFKHGYIQFLVMIGYTIGLLLLAKFVASKFDQRFDGMLSSADIMRKFYGIRAEQFTGLIGALFGVFVLGAQMTALAVICRDFLHIEYTTSVIVTGGILLVYASFGGIRSVAITDIIQFLILAVGIPLIANLCFQEVGDVNSLISSLPEAHTQIIHHEHFTEYIVYFLFGILPFRILWPPLIQRYLMAENAKQISKVTYIYAFLTASILLMAAYIAFSALQLFPTITPNAIISHTIEELLPIGLRGIAMAGMIAVIMSTADSFLNTSGILLTLNTFLHATFQIIKNYY